MSSSQNHLFTTEVQFITNIPHRATLNDLQIGTIFFSVEGISCQNTQESLPFLSKQKGSGTEFPFCTAPTWTKSTEPVTKPILEEKTTLVVIFLRGVIFRRILPGIR